MRRNKKITDKKDITAATPDAAAIGGPVPGAALPPPLAANSNIKRYDIFKNTTGGQMIINDVPIGVDDISYINNLLANLSVADTAHDIDKKDKGILGISGFLGTAGNIYARMYQKGIPVPYNTDNILDEESAVGSVIINSSFKWGVSTSPPEGGFSEPINNHDTLFQRHRYVPLRVMKYIKEGRITTSAPNAVTTTYSDSNLPFVRSNGQTHTIDTVNGNKYTVTYFDVKPEVIPASGPRRKGELITAEDFFQNMNYQDTNLPKNIAFVVDCTSVKIEQILNTGPRLGSNFNTYLIKSPEGENDPGGKTNLQSTTFQTYNDRGGNGVRYRAAVPYQLNKLKSYSYAFKNYQISPYTQFFTNYNFELSELQFNDKYIFSDLTTTLNIIDPNNIVPPKPVLNSGDMNEIGAVSNVIRNIMAKIESYGSKASAIDIFDYNCALQQKRSGDWLQALLCCLVASGERKFCEYNSPMFDLMSIFKKKEIQNGTLTDGQPNDALNFLPDDVYLVTHDRILLAFSLLLGINVIFTHHLPGTGKKYSYHSTSNLLEVLTPL